MVHSQSSDFFSNYLSHWRKLMQFWEITYLQKTKKKLKLSWRIWKLRLVHQSLSVDIKCFHLNMSTHYQRYACSSSYLLQKFVKHQVSIFCIMPYELIIYMNRTNARISVLEFAKEAAIPHGMSIKKDRHPFCSP